MSEDPKAADDVGAFLRLFADRVVAGVEAEDGRGRFRAERWERPDGGGGGESRVLEQGAVFEQAGVGYSNVYGDELPPSASKSRPELAGRGFEAIGVSLILHPRNPYVPATHANFRYFRAAARDAEPVWWFGGGFDLTPFYPFAEDIVHWHRTARDACAGFGDDVYPRFKSWCDDYFYLPHRDETRGVGGLFFDDLNEPGFDEAFALTRSIAGAFLPAYRPIVTARKDLDYGEREREFQLYRRGRYVEFNLLYDRGTLFGLQSGGRTESILMSLPPRARWEYNWQPADGSPEAELAGYLKPRNWLAESS